MDTKNAKLALETINCYHQFRPGQDGYAAMKVLTQFVRDVEAHLSSESPESGGRRQDAASDHGSERSSRDFAREIYDHWSNGRYIEAELQVERLQRAVSARSADSEGVLEQVIAYVESWADHKRHDAKDMKARNFTQAAANTLRDAKMLGRMALAIREKFQNQIKKPGLG